MAKGFNKSISAGALLGTLLGASSVFSLVALAPVAVAQSPDEAQESDSDDQPEGEELRQSTVVVSGFRQSLQDAVETKRNAQNISDGIAAEDIGKSPDRNIAEALQRVTGVSIERSEGEGTTVTVRGIDSNLNNVTLNGVSVTNAAGDVRGGSSGQAVDFSAFSSELLSEIRVVKTPSANQDEGSLGAAIELTTFKPLGIGKERRILDISSSVNTFAENDIGLNDIFGGDGRIGLSLSEKLFDNKIGLSLIASTEKNSGRVDASNVNRWQGEDASNAAPDPRVSGFLTGGFTNVNTGQLDTNGVGPENVLRALAPFEVNYAQTFFETKRDNVTGTIQYRPTNKTDIQLDVTYSEVSRDRDQSQLAVRPTRDFFPFWQGGDLVYDPDTNTLQSFRRTAFPFEPGLPGNATNIAYVRPIREIDRATEKSLVIGFDVQHEWNDFDFRLRGGNSSSQARDDDYIYATAQIENQALQGPESFDNGFNGFDARGGLTQGYDCLPGSACSIFLSDTVPNRTLGGTNGANPDLAIIDDAFEFDIGSINSRDRAIDDDASSLYFDVDWDHRFGPIKTWEAGLKWSKRTRELRQTNSFLSRFAFPGNERQNIQPFEVVGQQGLRDGFGEELGLPRDSITDGIMQWDPIALRNFIQESVPEAGVTTPDIRDFREITNEVYGAYLQANFELFDGRAFGDVGIRYAETEVTADGGATATVQFDQFTIRPENLAFFGYFGPGDPNNTVTLEQAQAAVIAVFGEDLIPRTDPAFVDPTGVLVSDSHEYDNFLPSANFNFMLTEDMLLRLAASKTMARPNIDLARPNFRFTENSFGDSFADGGNPQLNPFQSTNLDMSFEWYFDEGSLFSVALFNKDITDSERRVSQTFYILDPRDILFDENGVAISDPSQYGSAIGQPGFVPGQTSLLLPFDPNKQPAGCLPQRVFDISLVNGDPGCEIVQFVQPINAGKGYVRGAEISLQHAFRDLPGLLSNTGFTANYTYSDSEVEAQTITNALGQEVSFRAAPLPNTSLHTFNGTVYYEDPKLQLRLAYNTRSDYLVSSAPLQGGTRVYTEGYDSLDFSGGYQLTENLRFTVNAVNLLDTVRRNYAVLEADAEVPNALDPEPLGLGDAPTFRTQNVSNTGRIFRIGLRYEF